MTNEVFEVHITSTSPHIHHLCKANGIKSIEVELLTPQGDVLRTEHMTSHIFKCKNLTEGIMCVSGLIGMLSPLEIIRVKVECPPYPKYRHHAIYAETHFKDDTFSFATSRNKRSGKLLATDRTTDRQSFDTFLQSNMAMGHEVELCLLDTFVDEDKDWLSLWGQ